ncbi:uncharacterized protein YcbX [Mycobacterium frederiksbergense]|uniref:Uncharacterized protein YcbX n=1 Tax=Mycolicibacterium frederiksbergense TaxID=117567 RepID=A0ABT6L2V0_9MYCO|nr:MOSC N-terminal beta barrel domain-containing protein [Mycolicibacterium frederiksbergense]MDH6196630.1 uncharacterized protein YcbX [Mycolicibacterium frederiksbergense]
MYDASHFGPEPETRVGAVKTIFRFPIKSVGGHPIEQGYVSEQGLLGDRRYAFIDLESGNLCNAKNPRKYGSMLACRANYVEEPKVDEPLPTLEVRFPDGSVHRNVGADLDDAMSRHLGRPVRLITSVPKGSKTEIVWDEATGIPKDGVYAHTTTNADGDDVLSYAPVEGETFFDLTPLHLLTTSTIEHFQRIDRTANFDPRRYRPTMVIDTAIPGLVEDEWVGGRLALGDGLHARIDLCTPRCVMSTLAHDKDVPLDRSTLRTIVKHNTKVIPGLGRLACAGVYAGVISSGVVRVGDPVRFGVLPTP